MTDILNEPIAIAVPQNQEQELRIAILADESGSMLGAAKSTVESLNSYLDEQAQNEKATLVSVYTFNAKSGVRKRFSAKAKEAPRMHRNNDLFDNPDLESDLLYTPSGETPLHDAIADVIGQESRDTPTLVVILTDGRENASKEYAKLANIQGLIKQQEEAGWTFVWLMAGLKREDSVEMASKIMGRNYEEATMTYQKGLEDIAFQTLDRATKNWDGAARATLSSGKKLIGSSMAQNFFAIGGRVIKK